MRRILTSLPYEKRIGLPSAADGLTLTDSVRRTSLLPVADTHLDPDVESASGRLVKCDEAGSLLRDMKSRALGGVYLYTYSIFVDAGVTLITMPGGFRHLELHRTIKNLITGVYLTDKRGTVLQELFVDRILHIPGVVTKYRLQVTGSGGNEIDINAYHFK